MAAKKDTVITEEAKIVPEEPRFSKDVLRAKSMALYGVTTSTFDGAMFGHDKEDYSIGEVGTIIEEWLHGKAGK